MMKAGEQTFWISDGSTAGKRAPKTSMSCSISSSQPDPGSRKVVENPKWISPSSRIASGSAIIKALVDLPISMFSLFSSFKQYSLIALKSSSFR